MLITMLFIFLRYYDVVLSSTDTIKYFIQCIFHHRNIPFYNNHQYHNKNNNNIQNNDTPPIKGNPSLSNYSLHDTPPSSDDVNYWYNSQNINNNRNNNNQRRPYQQNRYNNNNTRSQCKICTAPHPYYHCPIYKFHKFKL